ncbi:hypothetical protein ACHAXA_011683 [Cyclostephanos tholiformis]|uniref:Uncharacterized protein n=1 Tax=Cyclostephanos tholiformis TaxID=382380 RepID=A0ABD3SEM6_9STRA
MLNALGFGGAINSPTQFESSASIESSTLRHHARSAFAALRRDPGGAAKGEGSYSSDDDDDDDDEDEGQGVFLVARNLDRQEKFQRGGNAERGSTSSSQPRRGTAMSSSVPNATDVRSGGGGGIKRRGNGGGRQQKFTRNNLVIQLPHPPPQDEINSDPATGSALAVGTMSAVRTTAVDINPRWDHPLAVLTNDENPPEKFDNVIPFESGDNVFSTNGDRTYSNDELDDDLDGEGHHTRQFSSDDRFFEGIHNSGLESLSFEQVSDVDLNTCMDVEIELVYNSSDLGSFDTDDEIDRDIGGFNEKERREMEKRILQWRKGRHAWMMNSVGGGAHRELGGIIGDVERGQEQQQEHQQREESFDIEDNCDCVAVELAPLPSAKSGTTTAAPTNIKKSSGSRRNHYHSKNGMPETLNSFLPPPSTSLHDDNDENDDEGGEARCLTSSSKNKYELRQLSQSYDDLNYFDRDPDHCGRYCCREAPSARYLRSGWKSLLWMSSFLFLLGWVFTDVKMKRFQEGSSEILLDDGQESNRGDNSIGRSKNIDDGDDYYESSALHLVEDDPRDHSSSPISNHRQNPPEYHGLEDDLIVETVASAASGKSMHHQASNIQFNKFVGIDTIIVLGICERHSTIAWLVDKLKRLYPDMKVTGGLPTIDSNATKKPTQRTLRNIPRTSRRLGRTIDPPSDDVIHHFGNVGLDASSEDDATDRNIAHQKPKNGHILVVAVSINPYAWIELMRVDSQHDPKYAPIGNNGGDILGWEEYVKAELPLVNGTILDLRAKNIRSALVESAQHDGVRVVIPVQFEDLVEPYSNYDNFASDESLTLPGIVGLLDQIQAQTGLRADESSGWQVPVKKENLFWADPLGCTGHVCFPTVNKINENFYYIRYLNENIDWSAEELIGYYKRSEPKPSVDQIVVLGERISGSEWLVEKLARCFPNTPVLYGFSRPGKWFQSEPKHTIASQSQTLVVSVFLNPLDWVENMRRHPINAPAHKGMDWHDFVTSPWVRKRSHLDDAISGTADANCSFGFSFEEVVPCKTARDPQSDSFPLYELHPASSISHAGDPYSSILELRADKIRNFLSAVAFDGVVDLISVRYEDLVWNEDAVDDNLYSTLPIPGIAGLLDMIRDRTSLVPDVDAGWVSDEDGTFEAEQLGVGAAKLDSHYVQWMNDHVNWEVEKLIGYSP